MRDVARTERRAASVGFEVKLDGKVQVKARVKSSNELMPGTWLVWLDALAIAEAARPGQFVMVRCAGNYDPLLRRPLSIHKTDGSGGVALLFEVVGRGTSWLSQLASGDCVDLMGPLGNGFAVKPGTRSLLLVAGGMGIAPLAFLAQEASKMGKKVTLLQGVKRAVLLCPKDRLPLSTTVVGISEDGFEGRTGLATDLISSHVEQADQVFACGPVPMYRALAGLDCLRGKPVQVSLEERMACGLGACYGCTVKTKMGAKQVCHDGPVFELSDIVWQG